MGINMDLTNVEIEHIVMVADSSLGTFPVENEAINFALTNDVDIILKHKGKNRLICPARIRASLEELEE